MRRSLWLAGAALAATAPALAQTAAPPPTTNPTEAQNAPQPQGGLEDIVVTAQRRAENLQDTPLAVTAITGEELAQRGLTTTQSLGSSVPGLVLKPTTGTYSSAAFFIRGIGQKSVFNTFDPGVGVYVDDVYVGRTAFGVRTIFDLDRVEVLRGPQGTLYGRNTSGGAIKLVTARPDPKEFSGRAEAAYGNYHRWSLAGALNVPLGSDLAFRASGTLERQDEGFIRLTTLGGRGNKADTDAVRGSLRWNPGALDWTISGDWQELRADGRYGATLTDGVSSTPDGLLVAATRYRARELDRSSSPIRANNDAEEWGFSSNLAYDLGGATAKSITSYRDFDVDLVLDANNGGLAFAVAQRGHQVSQEFQITGQALADRLTYTGGLYYFSEKTRQVVDLDLVPFALPLLNAATRVTTDAYAIYAQLTYGVTDALRLTAGARMSWEDKRVRAATLGFLNTPVFDQAALEAAGARTRRDDDKFTPKVAVEFDATDDVLLYASYTKGFKGGGFQSTAGSIADFVSFAPEEVDAYEIGVKSEWFDRRLRLNIAAYWNDYQDIQLDTLLPTGSIVQLNVAKARVRGVEAEATARLTEWFDLFGFVSYIDDRIQRVTAGAASLGTREGGKLNDVPDWQTQLGANLRAPFLPGLSGQIVWAFQDRVFNTVTPPSPIQLIRANDNVDARIRYEPEGSFWFVQGDCRNCFDERYYTARLSFAPGYPAIPNDPATFNVRAGVRF